MKQVVILCLLAALFFLPQRAAAQKKQGQARLDSLLAEAPKMADDTAAVKLMDYISGMYSTINPDEGLKWAARELALAQKLGWRKGEGFAYNDFGNSYNNKAAYPEALEAYIKSLRIAEERGDGERAGAVSGNIGNVYHRQKDYPKALEWYFKSLKAAEGRGDKTRMQAALGNIGSVYQKQGKYSDALEYQKKSLAIAEELNDKRGIIIQTGNIGTTYAGGLKQYNEALPYYYKALRMAEEMGGKQSIAINLGNIGEAYYSIAADSAGPRPDSLVPAGKAAILAKAIDYLNRGIAACREGGFKEYIPSNAETLTDALALQDDYKGALAAYKAGKELKDSLFNKANTEKLTRTEVGYQYARREDSLRAEGEKRALLLQKESALAALRYEYDKKQAAAKSAEERRALQYEEELKRRQIAYDYAQQSAAIEAETKRKATLAKAKEVEQAALAAAELSKERSRRNAGYAVAAVLGLAALGAGWAFVQKRRDNRIISREKARSESLLLNILPAEVAEELKEKGEAHAQQYDAVSVLFTDFVDFTGTAQQLSPQALVRELHECFTAFDAIIEANGLEKIKTIGDAYMAVCGLPAADPRHAQRTVQAALEIRDFIAERKSWSGCLKSASASTAARWWRASWASRNSPTTSGAIR